jgi:hypothetical protein
VLYCLEKCKTYKIYDACIYLERKSGNIAEAIKLVNLLIKEDFNNLKKFYQENYDIIKNEKDNSEEDQYINELIEAEEEMKKGKNRTKEEEILYQKKVLIRKQDKILKLGTEICESSSQMPSSREDSKKIWQSLISMYYELINGIKVDITQKKINKELGDYLIKELENRAGEITEIMNSYFDLNSVLQLISQIQGESFGSKEYKSLLKRLLFSGESFNRILQAADSILKNNVLDSTKEYKIDTVLGQKFNFERCDFCGKIFKEKDKNSILMFNCGHTCHDCCCIYINKEISCRICYEYEYENEETLFREENEIKLPKEQPKDKRRQSVHKRSSVQGIMSKADKEKIKRLKLINEINDSYFELSKVFEGNN